MRFGVSLPSIKFHRHSEKAWGRPSGLRATCTLELRVPELQAEPTHVVGS